VSAFDLALLDDPRGALPPYDALLLLGPDVPPGVAEALAPLVGAIDVDTMREANRRVDVDGATPAAAAAWLLEATGTARSPGGTRGGARDR
jgi:osmoprotectant transport system permease protein